jgi:hypothetical protein
MKVCNFTCEKHLHDHIISQNGKLWTHKTSLTLCLYQARKVSGRVFVAGFSSLTELSPCNVNYLKTVAGFSNMNNLSPEKSATGHDYDNVSIGKCKLNLCTEKSSTAQRLAFSR